MANTFGNPIILDTFTSIVDVASSLGYAAGTPLKVNSIEWQEPTTLAHTAVVTDGLNGADLLNETCTTANQSIIKYFHGAWVKNIYIAVSGVASGKIVILLF